MNSNPSRPGLRQGGSDEFELLLDTRGGEVLTAYAAQLRLADKIKSQRLSGAKSVKFPAFWNADVEYHTPGVEITGGQIASQDITVSPDDKLISSAFVSDVDEALFDVEVRHPYTEAIGRALAEFYDANIARMIIKASRQGALFTGDDGGGAVTDANFASSGTAIFDGLSEAKEAMDAKKVPVDSHPIYGVLPTAQWYLLARTDKILHADYMGSGVKRFALTTVDDIEVIKSNNLPYGTDDSANTDIPSEYRIDMTNTRGAVFTPYAAATVVVQDPGLQIIDQPHKQGTLLLGRHMVGTRPLRSKAAMELKIA